MTDSNAARTTAATTRGVVRVVRGMPTSDGAGVKLETFGDSTGSLDLRGS